ncbi:hypothetical protein ACIQMR_19520 [Streptomyces sp. NPDC091376]
MSKSRQQLALPHQVTAPLRARLVAVTLADQAGAALDTAGPLLDA